MAAQHWRPFATLLILFLALHAACSEDPPEPEPAPEIGADSNYPISYPPLNSPAPEIGADSNFPISYPPLNSPPISSSPAISPFTETYGSPSPSPAPETSLPQSSSPSPSPSTIVSPLVDADADADPDPDTAIEDDFPSNRSSVDSIAAATVDDRMSGGKKAGVVFGVLIGGGIVFLAGIVCKKRRENIRRSRYGYATRRGLI